MKKIGFVDYYISEWHADNYVGWIEKANEVLNTDYKVTYAWAELNESPKGVSTKEWCETYGVTPCATLAELCEKSDVIVILAPSDPEKHLAYVKEVFPYGKRVYVDKTFAPDLATAQEIFAIAKEYNTPFFSTSALRYASELDEYKNVKELILLGGGSNIEEYIIHQVENVVRLLGCGKKTVCVTEQDTQRIIQVRCDNGKRATLLYASPLPFVACVQQEGEKSKYLKLASDFFSGLMADILRFFENGTLPFDSKETLAVMALRDAILKANANPGTETVTEEI